MRMKVTIQRDGCASAIVNEKTLESAELRIAYDNALVGSSLIQAAAILADVVTDIDDAGRRNVATSGLYCILDIAHKQQAEAIALLNSIVDLVESAAAKGGAA